jgi:serine/threonine protein kinase
VPKYRAGDTVAGFVLVKKLGSGGNGVVWQVRNRTGDEFALKILTRLDGEGPERFRREADTQLQLTREGFEGILPVLEAGVPDRPSDADPAWLLMPIAMKLKRALGPSPTLDKVVEVVQAVAATLARLAGRSVYHRDIKPDNLFRHANRWKVGDFGLISLPDVRPLTVADRGLGARNFMAPEMLVAPHQADGGPADVYAVAKTLWALAARRGGPPLAGEMPADIRAVRLSEYVLHPRARRLDILIERACRTDPTLRPTMPALADDLAAWLSPPGQVAGTELGHLSEEIHLAMELSQRHVRSRRERIRRSEELFAVLQTHLSRVEADLRNAGFGWMHPDTVDQQVLRLIGGAVNAEVEWDAVRTVKVGRDLTLPVGPDGERAPDPSLFEDPPGFPHLWAAITIRSLSGGDAVIGAGYLIGPRPRSLRVLWSARRQVMVGTALADEQAAQLGAELASHLEEAVTELLAQLRRL